MPIKATKYVRNPLYVDAVEVTDENFGEVVQWCMGEVYNTFDDSPADKSVPFNPSTQYIRLRVHNPQSTRQTRASVGDWILYTERGYKIYTDMAFKNNFTEVPEKVAEEPVLSVTDHPVEDD